MRRVVPAVALIAIAAGLTVAAVPASAVPTLTALRAGHGLRVGQHLTSPSGAYRAGVEGDGRVVVRTRAGRWVWSTPRVGPDAVLYVGRTGRLIVASGGQVRWTARTAGSGTGNVLTVRDTGTLALSARYGLTVWTSRLRNACPRTAGNTFTVDIGDQAARMCSGGRQLRVTRVTTGAAARGDGTPTGSWRVQARVRHTTLHPSSGGAYPVRYWVPYDGAYGIHDSSWQHFAYGSPLYRTRGSHGCTHVPARAMAWFFAWARVGTRVTIHG